MTRNEAARARADDDPAAVADHATGANMPNLTARLAEWPVPGVVDPGELATARREMATRGEAGHDLDPDETAAADEWEALTRFEQMERRVVAQRQHDAAEANQTADWHAMMARDLAAQWVQREALAAVRWDKLNIRPPSLAGAAVPARLVAHLANLPELRVSDTGLSMLTVLVEAMPVTVEHETRADRRIMPALRGPSPERERGILFGGLVDDRPREVGLPLFPDLEPSRLRVPLLEIVDASGVPLRNRGKGAPVEARLLVRGGLLMIRPQDRGREYVRIAVTVGELLDGLYPTVGRNRDRRRIAENWPKIEAALRTARDFTVTDETGGRWFPMALRRLPAERPDGAAPELTDLVVIDLAPPPGAGTGPTIDLPALDDMGLRSGPAWYAYIAARSLVWLPGTTRRPAPKVHGWGWSRDPSDYPVLTLADLRRFAFGPRDAKNRTRAAILAPWSSLPDVVVLPNQTDARTGVRGYRLLPAEAAEALRRSQMPVRKPGG